MPMPVKFSETEIPGVLLVEVGCFRDDRGFFSEAHSETVWREAKFKERFVQDKPSLSRKGALRGLHYPNRVARYGQTCPRYKGVCCRCWGRSEKTISYRRAVHRIYADNREHIARLLSTKFYPSAGECR
jgi:dTDP-4-dehydrorhamnose 3,5-epimerase